MRKLMIVAAVLITACSKGETVTTDSTAVDSTVTVVDSTVAPAITVTPADTTLVTPEK
jgi:hypothetical protein